MSQLLDLQVEIASRPPEASETAAPITLRCKALKLQYDEGVFSYPLTKGERDDLSWYLEDYWKWPFEGFTQRGSAIEQLLPALGQRLYQAAFGHGAARDIIQQWQADTSGTHQISIITTDAGFLSLPWELLHNGQDFLALQTNPPISIARRIDEEQQPSLLPEATFEKPLRVLLVTARPVDDEQVDVRTIAREVVDALQEQREAGNIELEFLRPPTLDKLIERLGEKERPIHILHFDGHGEFRRFSRGQDDKNEEEGRLLFEKEDGKKDSSVDAASLAEMLHYGGVQVAVLNACKSAAIGERDISSSVAIQLLKGGLQAVVAMSASIQTTSAALYVKAFYRALAADGSIQAAHRQAQQVLHNHLERNLLQRRVDEARKPVNLQDWWLPYLYIQRPLVLQPVREELQSQPSVFTPSVPQPNRMSPASSTYEFTGRSAELLLIERSLLRRRIVVVSGFGGIGKTALAREAADWLIRTEMYDTMCFISFERDSDTSIDLPAALAILTPLLKKQHILIIVDSVESILLPSGNMALDNVGCDQLWGVLVQLWNNGAGVLITSRNPKLDVQLFANGTQVDYWELKGLASDDAYTLAVQVINKNRIDLAHIPYLDLCDLLAQIDNHPLAIRLVLPTLQRLRPGEVQANFASLLSTFRDDQATGRNRSLLASLDYSLCYLSAEQQALLPKLALFEGGVLESRLLQITEIPESEWADLRATLEQVGLLTTEQVHELVLFPFLHFHPLLIPFLRSQSGVAPLSLRQRFTSIYIRLADYLVEINIHQPGAARSLARCELPNLLRALDLLLEADVQEAAVGLADRIAEFFRFFGRQRELEALHQKMETTNPSMGGPLTQTEYFQESNLGETEFHQGYFKAAHARFAKLLIKIEAQPESAPLGRNSHHHCLTLMRLAQCLRHSGQPSFANARLQQAMTMIESLLKQDPEDRELLKLQSGILTELGGALRMQGKYQQAQEVYEESLRLKEPIRDVRGQVVVLGQLGTLALDQKRYAEARQRYEQMCDLGGWLNEPSVVAIAWYQLGIIAMMLEEWAEAERCYRVSLILEEQLQSTVRVADICNMLGRVASSNHRPEEAETWYKRALEIIVKAMPEGKEHAGILTNFALLLMIEAQTGRMNLGRLAEARGYAEQALAIQKLLDVSLESSNILGILALIAEMEGRTETAREYRRLERETFASFEGNHHPIDQQYGRLITAVAETARGNPQLQMVDLLILPLTLPKVEAENITNAILRIFQGERDWHTLAEGMDRSSALLILRILETLEQLPPPLSEKTITQEFEQFTLAVVAAAKGQEQARTYVEKSLLQLEEHGWRISGAIQRIWAGERTLALLVDGIDKNSALIIKRVLELFEQPPPAEDASEVNILEQLINLVVAAVKGHEESRAVVEEMLPRFEAGGFNVAAPIRRIWAGERELPSLVEGLDVPDTRLIRKMLRRLVTPVVEESEKEDTEEEIEESLEKILIALVVWATQGHAEAKASIEKFLLEAEDQGWHIAAPIQRIWAGERDMSSLAEELDEQDRVFIERILELLAASVQVERHG